MGIFTISNISVQERRQVYRKYTSYNDEHLSLDLPEGYLFFSLLCLSNLTKVLENRDPLPKSIIVDLDLFSLDKVKPVIQELRRSPSFSNIPVVGLVNQEVAHHKVNELLAAGLDDCFYGKVDWNKVSSRIDFLRKHRESFQQHSTIEPTSYTYAIPKSKRLFDICAASVGLILSSPLFLLLAILIKLESKGSVFYSSKRIGIGYEEFDFLKFRSMKEDADMDLKEYEHLNSYDLESSQKNAFVKLKNDPRVTRVGKWIRKTSIDEIPQLINVLRGEMSIIGNRPLPLYEAEKMTQDDWARRFLAPAGLTGLWQVDKRGKDNLSTEERVELDVTYAKKFAFKLDLKIVLRTLPAMWQRD